MRAYAIGDIHGQFDLFCQAHERIARDAAQYGPAPVIHLGDIVDRGPQSSGVITQLRKGISEGEDWIVLCGNHDRMFTKFMADPHWIDPRLSGGQNWLHPRVGGAATLASYGVKNAADRPIAPVHTEALDRVPPEDLAFLAALSLWHRIDDLLFVHAGIRPNVPLPAQEPEDLLWIREPFLSDRTDHGVLVIHGHTALPAPIHYGNRLNIDSSAGYGGPLSAVVIEGREVFLLTDQGRQSIPITPDALVR